jgi:hypothetical protein
MLKMKYIHIHSKDAAKKENKSYSHVHFFFREVPSFQILLSLLVIALLIYIGNLNRVFVITLLLMGFAAFVQFYTHARDVKFDIGHVFFFSLVYARVAGLLPAALLIIIAGMIPKFILGDIDEQTILSYVGQLLVIAISLLFTNFSIILVGIIAAVICFSIVFFLEFMVFQKPIFDLAMDVVLPLIMNIAYFVSLSQVLLKLLYSLIL